MLRLNGCNGLILEDVFEDRNRLFAVINEQDLLHMHFEVYKMPLSRVAYRTSSKSFR